MLLMIPENTSGGVKINKTNAIAQDQAAATVL